MTAVTGRHGARVVTRVMRGDGWWEQGQQGRREATGGECKAAGGGREANEGDRVKGGANTGDGQMRGQLHGGGGWNPAGLRQHEKAGVFSGLCVSAANLILKKI